MQVESEIERRVGCELARAGELEAALEVARQQQQQVSMQSICKHMADLTCRQNTCMTALCGHINLAHCND